METRDFNKYVDGIVFVHIPANSLLMNFEVSYHMTNTFNLI